MLMPYIEIINLCLTFALTGVHFQGELNYNGYVGWQKNQVWTNQGSIILDHKLDLQGSNHPLKHTKKTGQMIVFI